MFITIKNTEDRDRAINIDDIESLEEGSGYGRYNYIPYCYTIITFRDHDRLKEYVVEPLESLTARINEVRT